LSGYYSSPPPRAACSSCAGVARLTGRDLFAVVVLGYLALAVLVLAVAYVYGRRRRSEVLSEDDARANVHPLGNAELADFVPDDAGWWERKR
jgi:hypothetical protein